MESVMLTFAELTALLRAHAPDAITEVLESLGAPTDGNEAVVEAGVVSLLARGLLWYDEETGGVLGEPALAAMTRTLGAPAQTIDVLAAAPDSETPGLSRLVTGVDARVLVTPAGYLNYRVTGVRLTADVREVVGDIVGQLSTVGGTITLQATSDESTNSVLADVSDDAHFAVRASSTGTTGTVDVGGLTALLLDTARKPDNHTR